MARTAFNVLDGRDHPLTGKRAAVNAVYAVMAVLWFSWAQMCFFDPVRAELPGWLRYSGLSLFLAGIFLFVLAHATMKGVEGKDRLVGGGIYRRVRNPMYLGFILWVFGFPMFTKSLVTLASAPVWAAFILYWQGLEERKLERKHQGYAEYKRSAWL